MLDLVYGEVARLGTVSLDEMCGAVHELIRGDQFAAGGGGLVEDSGIFNAQFRIEVSVG